MSFGFSSKSIIAGAVGAVLATGLCAGTAAAESPKDFYRGKTVTFVVPYGPGGGYDTYARMMAEPLSKQLGANVVVENQPGAGGLLALNKMYIAEPNGLQLMIINGTAAAASQIVDQASVHYDLGQLDYIATVASSPWMWLVNDKFPIKTPKEAVSSNKLIRWAASGPVDGLSDGAAITCYALKLNCQIILGYNGSHQSAAAVGKGEMDALYVSDTSANNYVKQYGLVPVANMSREKSRFFQDVPTIYQALDLSKDQQWWFDFRSTLDALGRILVTTPGTPKDRLQFMRAAAKSVLTDPDFIAKGEKIQRYINYVSAEDTEERVHKVVTSLSPDRKKLVKKVVLDMYR